MVYSGVKSSIQLNHIVKMPENRVLPTSSDGLMAKELVSTNLKQGAVGHNPGGVDVVGHQKMPGEPLFADLGARGFGALSTLAFLEDQNISLVWYTVLAPGTISLLEL